jgi:hypothetical protein
MLERKSAALRIHPPLLRHLTLSTSSILRLLSHKSTVTDLEKLYPRSVPRASRSRCRVEGMVYPPTVLLIGCSLTLAAIAASLRGQAQLTVRQVDAWPAVLAGGQAAPAAVIVDSASAVVTLAALMAAYPRVLLMEVGGGANGDLQVTVHHSEQRPLDDGNELVTLILEHALMASAAGANEL